MDTLKIEEKLEKSLTDVLAFENGKRDGFRVYKVSLPELDVKQIRRKVDMTQEEFAKAYAIPLATLQNWEQKHRQPDAVASMFLRLISERPEEVRKLLRSIPKFA